jgi:hypothetical protein
MKPREIEAHVGQAEFERVRHLLSTAFRATVAPQPVSDLVVASVIESEWRARRSPPPAEDGDRPRRALAFLCDPPDGWSPWRLPLPGGSTTYYDGHARHERVGIEKPGSAFMGLLPQVRISLPATRVPSVKGLMAKTAIGYIWSQDHLLKSVADVQKEMTRRFGAAKAGKVSRVDLVCPGRLGGRFGAIGMYLGYRSGEKTPSFYLLEAGMATGPSVRLYASPDLGDIPRTPTAYLPTPFVELSNDYTGSLTLDGEHPSRLVVCSYRSGVSTPRVRVTIDYTRRTAATVAKIAPADLTLTAAERIAAIGDALGENAIALQSVLAPAGRLLPWLRKP